MSLILVFVEYRFSDEFHGEDIEKHFEQEAKLSLG